VKWHSTTILCVRCKDKVAIGGDGQVTLGTTIMKHDTRKIRWVLDNKVLVGFAGSTADAFALLERFEAKAKNYPGNIPVPRPSWPVIGEPTVCCAGWKP